MNISLTPELTKWINKKVARGLYTSASEVVREGLRLLLRQEEQKKEMLKNLRNELLVGEQQVKAGKTLELTDDLFEQVKKEARDELGL